MQGSLRRALRIACLALTLAALALGAHGLSPARAAQPLAAPTPPAAFANPQAACRAALDVYVERFAPGRRFALGAVQQLEAWAYAYAQEVDAAGRPAGERFIALLAHQEPGSGWYALAPRVASAAEYNALLERFPAALSDESLKAYLRQPEVAVALAAFTGHRLPWTAGRIAYLTQKDTEQHLYQADFDIEGLAAAGQVRASKPGTVVFVKQSSHEGACDPSARGKENLVVIQHDTGEYSWYLHLAPGSVPVQVGQRVSYGTVIGIEGTTGYACGTHVHYMASTGHTAWTDPNDPNTMPWATGVAPVDFDEVPWAGLVEGSIYTSQNSPSVTGIFVSPAEGTTVAGDVILLQAQVVGERGLPYAHFVAYYGGAWHTVGPDFTGPNLGYYWDTRAAGAAAGPITLALELSDAAGKVQRLPAERHITR